MESSGSCSLRRGQTVNRKRVERLMRKHGIEGRHLRRCKRTTVPDRLAPLAPDLVNRNFHAGRLDEKWCGDITYVQVGGTWLYLASVLDVCSRRVLSWSMAPHMRVELVINALKMAVATRGGSMDGVIFYADRGSQHTSAAFAQVCDGFKIHRSMGRVGSSYDSTPSPRVSGRASREKRCTRGFSRRCARRDWRSSGG
ncbi:IS3 family transposase [Streptomyces sp. M2CJ-2]|nr:IS3 family transposase [Streptomyces sp. M2CJ-2]